MATDVGARFRPELLDCVQVNLALLSDGYHGPGSHLRLGSELWFRPAAGPDGLPSVEPSVDEQLAAAERLAGVRMLDRGGRAELPAPAESRYLVADAYYLPWCPYFGQQHGEHSFLIEATADGHLVIDGYSNETPWGPARPLRQPWSASELGALLSGVPGGVRCLRPAPSALGDRPAPAALIAADLIAPFVEAYRAYPDRALALERLALQTWLLARQRQLYAGYLADYSGQLCAQVAEQLQGWNSLAEQTYLAYRRVARGRAEPTSLFGRLAELLSTDQAAFGRPGPAAGALPAGAPDAGPAWSAGADPAAIRPVVVSTVAEVLGVDRQLIERGDLSRIASFTSLRMVEIVEQLEADFELEFVADQLVPERLYRLDDLCELIRHTLAER